jgi:hypothetical protein
MSTHTPVPDELDHFETRLLAELRREVDGLAPVAARRPRRTIAAIAGAAAAAVAAVVLVPGLGTSAAYSVQEGNSGEVVVEITRPEDAAGLEQALADHGIAADVTYLPDLATCAPGRYVPVAREVGLSLAMGRDLVRVTLPPGAVRDGETFVMVWSVEPAGEHGTAASVVADVTADPVGACQVVGAPKRTS